MSHDHANPPSLTRHCDVAVIGGSAAGLAGALQLVRQRRSVIVVDDGSPRNAPAAHMHGYLGREGAAPGELRSVGRDEVRAYGGEVLDGRVLAVHREEDGFRVELSGGHALIARRVLVATGLVDELPPIRGLRERWGREVIHCPFCHGWEVRDQRVVQIVTAARGLHPTPLMRHLCAELTVVLHGEPGVDAEALRALRDSGVPVLEGTVERVIDHEGALLVELVDGTALPADAILTGSRVHPRLDALAPLELEVAPHPAGVGEVLVVDPTGRTSVDGVFAAGNVSDGGAQVLPAAANGSMIGAQIAFSLAGEDLAAGTRPSGVQTEWDARYEGREPIWSGDPNGSLVVEVGGMTPGRVLDVGAGEGGDAIWLAQRGWDVTAVDVSANALARLRAAAEQRGVEVRTLVRDANAPAPYGAERYDLVSLQYGSFPRTPEQRGLRSLLDAVAVGGTLLAVGHEPTWTRERIDVAEQTRMYDPAAFVGVDEIAAALVTDPAWRIELHETRPRPAGAASGHHVHDVVLRAVRVTEANAAS
ncbi:FAD-dependent oxidoreductase [Microbacterium sp. CR_7]|uniref:FAD-dependent oxidoreductase n=1 Tax=Microbacterium sp. CR_7 TaxID=3055792 RepID=UPI0035C2433E